MAYELQGAKEKQKIRSEEIEIDVVERKKQIDIEEKEIVRKEKELIGSVRLPAEAEAYKMQTVSEGAKSVSFVGPSLNLLFLMRLLLEQIFELQSCFPLSAQRGVTLDFCKFRTQTVEAARAEGEKIRLVGAADAAAIEAVGNAEAEKMRLKAAAYKQYGDAAMLSLVLETLPKVKPTHHITKQQICADRGPICQSFVDTQQRWWKQTGPWSICVERR